MEPISYVLGAVVGAVIVVAVPKVYSKIKKVVDAGKVAVVADANEVKVAVADVEKKL